MSRTLPFLVLLAVFPASSCARHDSASPKVVVVDPIEPDPPVADSPPAYRPRPQIAEQPNSPTNPGGPVPEISSLVMLAVGLVLVAATSAERRRRLRS